MAATPQKVWCPDSEKAWVVASVLEQNLNVMTVEKDDTGEQVHLPLTGKNAIEPEEVDEIGLAAQVENLVDLESFTEGMILHHVRQRFEANAIYTFVGSILVAVNPFQRLPIYTPEMINEYRLTTRSGPAGISPHVYATAGVCFNNMEETRASQSVLISGESGAGKTETTKKVLQFIAQVASGNSSGRGSIEDQILRSNPVLESFGNAKTLRNDNSSRFGKWMEVDFDKSNQIKGSRIVSYLLEKIRVVNPGPHERTYHVFYMLLQAADATVKNDVNLSGKSETDFHYLRHTGCFQVESRDEHEEWSDMMTALDVLSFSPEDQAAMLRILAGMLYLGNTQFEMKAGSESEEHCVKPEAKPDLELASQMLGLDPVSLEHAFVFREMKQPGGGDPIDIPRDGRAAEAQRDATAKTIYGQIFLWIIDKVNTTLFNGHGHTHIGLLDIFGFEVFEENSFEQLCINFANEKLQYFFNDIIFREEMSLYKQEGVPYESITFRDNSPCIELIEAKSKSVLATLDEEAHVPQGSDQKWVAKMHAMFTENKATASDYYGRNRKRPDDFVIRHFAATVNYSSHGFMEKNKDELCPQILRNILHSQQQLLVNVFDTLKDSLQGSTGRKGRLSLGQKFKNDLNQLMSTLQATTPHFIRCVKPNQEKVPQVFTSGICLDQLKNAGLFEAIRIRKAGYMFRMNFQDFWARYCYCADAPPSDTSLYDKCLHVVRALNERYPDHDGIKHGGIAVGKSKVFQRTIATKHLFEELRNFRIQVYIVKIQAAARMIIIKQRVWKDKWEREKKLAEARKEEERKKMLEEKGHQCATKVQSLARGARTRRDFADLKAQAEKERAAEAERQAELKRIEAQKDALHKAASTIIGLYRMARALKTAKERRIVHMLDDVLDQCNEGLLQRNHGHSCYNPEDESALLDAISAARRADVNTDNVLKRITQCEHLADIFAQARHLEERLVEAAAGTDVAKMKALLREAAANHMEDTDAFQATQHRVEIAARSTDVQASLAEILEQDDAATIVNAADAIDSLIRETQIRELAVSTTLLLRARDKLRKYRPLLKIRDELRLAVELASLSAIEEAVGKRNSYASLLGHSFCGTELEACTNMARMLRLEQQYVSRSGADAADGGLPPDTRLPPYVFRELLDLHESSLLNDPQTMAELRDGRHSEHLRIFKWVIGFSTWRHEENRMGVSEPQVGAARSAPVSPARRKKGASLSTAQATARATAARGAAGSISRRKQTAGADKSARKPWASAHTARLESKSSPHKRTRNRGGTRTRTAGNSTSLQPRATAAAQGPADDHLATLETKRNDYHPWMARAATAALTISATGKQRGGVRLKPPPTPVPVPTADRKILETLEDYQRSYEASSAQFWRDWAV